MQILSRTANKARFGLRRHFLQSRCVSTSSQLQCEYETRYRKLRIAVAGFGLIGALMNRSAFTDTITKEELREIFSKFDSDNDGKLQLNELHEGLKREYRFNVKFADLIKLVEAVDRDYDYELDFEEFTDMALEQIKHWKKHKRQRVPLSIIEHKRDFGDFYFANQKARFYPFGNVQVRRISGELSIKWKEKPRTVLVLKKHRDKNITKMTEEFCTYLRHKGLSVVVEPNAHDSGELMDFPAFALGAPGEGVDMCVCLGGDGTLLHLNSLFGKSDCIPPVASFALGSLGFLTPFEFEHAEAIIERILGGDKEPIPVALRTRLVGQITRSGETKPTISHTVINEVLLDRGGVSTLVQVEVFVDNQLVTLAQADGLIISTPTGSTAYSMSAGGPMVAPTAPVILLTPICPHSLSFRPLVLPDSVVVKLKIPPTARHGAVVSFDGRNRVQLEKGDEITIYLSNVPLTSIKMERFNREWFNSIQSKLHWNLREKQKQLC